MEMDEACSGLAGMHCYYGIDKPWRALEVEGKLKESYKNQAKIGYREEGMCNCVSNGLKKWRIYPEVLTWKRSIETDFSLWTINKLIILTVHDIIWSPMLHLIVS